jgi:hypothetical protein
MSPNKAELWGKTTPGHLSTITVDKFVGKLWTRQVSHLFVTLFSCLAVFYTL